MAEHILDQVTLGALVIVRDKMMAQQAAGRKVYRLEVGDTSFNTPAHIRKAIVDALERRIADLSPGSLTVDLLLGYGGPRMQGRCLMSVLHPLIDWDGTIYLCAFFNHRKAGHSIGSIADNAFFDCWGSSLHRERIRQVDPAQCVANCPLLRYNPVIEFILREEFRFPYI